MTFAVLFDHSRTFLPAEYHGLGRTPEVTLVTAVIRAVLYGLVPLAVVLLVFRDRPSRYGLTLGDWRWGIGLVVIGCLVMTPIVLWFATLPDVRAYYGRASRHSPNWSPRAPSSSRPRSSRSVASSCSR